MKLRDQPRWILGILAFLAVLAANVVLQLLLDAVVVD